MTTPGKNLSLTRMTAEDYDLLAAWSSSLTGVYASATVAFVSGEELREHARESGHTYLMATTDDGERVGCFDYRQVTYPGSYELGLGVGNPDTWGAGYGAEVVDLAIEHLFHVLNAHRVQGTIGLYNHRILGMALRRGFTVEALMRDFFFLDGGYQDAVLVSILRDDYYRRDVPDRLAPARDRLPQAERAAAIEALRAHLEEGPKDHLLELLTRPRRDPASS
ncbi:MULTISPECIES: GNAT family protein [unclassified Embleya]|uniref:GNAT family N-acetyltransferase n=1 Tax=unclassified Embleya TaxID=2699296 RepID=UPI00340E9C75